ncbi:hypothetical protein JEU11_14850 [Paraglaciecola chathamensis]|jgi:hypothetical protein|uniref:Lipoprotein n=1 Tax=Paraglaciecola chathamensis TaxID=368405 RepID=A0ABS0WGZ6_9ALTE|nr:hypothetical protein [Paraglaciecola chathamensis]MBJ2137737.1 hypothetical protein [Paraglaciecola chathamensis]|tara:strand:- start:433 stop:873 length:441 start_codon:yes stop_codon:yes gene_type:complete
MNKLTQLYSVIAISLLSGCASYTVEPYKDVQQLPELYLRGVFTWWEADPQYLLINQSGSVYATTIELIADGQPYDFKFADKDWTPGSSCGYRSKFRDQDITLNEPVYADCNTTDENFKFIPKETGRYTFSINFSNIDKPIVKVSKL